ncbi:MAG: 2-oxo acid dehydrogenase subunit E2 [Coxiellaceae bacterium]|nr:MAG: 2-oxo acid dehydrogenase subunit E2 [Coxiellaceae bacterium]
MKIFNLPDLGEGLPDAEIREWYVTEGDAVKREQPLAAMETAKAVVDVPSPYSGKISKLYGKPGDIIKTGEPLVGIETEAGTEPSTVETKATATPEVNTEAVASGEVKATPAVRALAKSLNVDLNTVTPSGANNTITIADVQQAAQGATTPAAAKSTAIKGTQLHGVRRAMAQNMAIAHQNVVPITLQDRADIQHWPAKTDVTVRLLRAIVAACAAEPAMNAHFDGKSISIQPFKEVNIGIAVDTADGLYVPVIKDAGNQSDQALRDQINQFKAMAEKQNFPPEILRDLTITLSNFGTIAGRYANPIVVPPTVAIIGIGKSSDEVVAINGQPAIHRILPISLTFDHRAATGGEAARFLAAFIKALEQ